MPIEKVNKKNGTKPIAQESLRGYAWTSAIGCLVLLVAGIVYSRMKGYAAGLVIPIIAAFLIELPLYLAPFFASARSALSRAGRWKVATGLAVSALLPYLVYAVPTGCFTGWEFYKLFGLAVSLSFWYLVIPGAIWSDLLFLLGPAAVMIAKLMRAIYVSPLPKERIDILGHLMLIHVAAIAVLVIRGLPGVNPGLIPTRREAWIGLKEFLFFLPAGVILVRVLPITARAHPRSLLLAAPIFCGIYLVTAFSEEFAMRGVLQQHLSTLLGANAGWIVTSILFGLVHLNYGFFPNWWMAIMAAAAGLFYGLAYREAGSIRASMITHGLTVTMWLIWFR
jgi:membrane protease YdiL (CAAX protease family)